MEARPSAQNRRLLKIAKITPARTEAVVAPALVQTIVTHTGAVLVLLDKHLNSAPQVGMGHNKPTQRSESKPLVWCSHW